MTDKQSQFCPICKAKTGTQYLTKVTSTPYFVTTLEFGNVLAGVIVQYFRCMSCGIILQNPRMTDEEIEKFYSSGEYRREIQMTPEEQDRDELARAKNNVRFLSEHMDAPKKHLDIGASKFHFLNETGSPLKVGVEPFQEEAPPEGVINYKSLTEVKEKGFDFVSLVHVLEHVPYPMDVLLQATKKLKKGGYLYIEVPSNNSKGGWARLAHLYHFEPFVMKRILDEIGVRVITQNINNHYQILAKK